MAWTTRLCLSCLLERFTSGGKIFTSVGPERSGAAASVAAATRARAATLHHRRAVGLPTDRHRSARSGSVTPALPLSVAPRFIWLRLSHHPPRRCGASSAERSAAHYKEQCSAKSFLHLS